MDRTTLHDVVVPVTGFVFLGLALVLVAAVVFSVVRGRALEQSSVQFDVPKLGLSLRGDRLTFLALLSCLVALVPLAFWYQGFHAELDKAHGLLQDARTRASESQALLDRMKFYDLWVNPRLPGDVDVRRIRENVQVAISRPGGGAPRLDRPHDVQVGPPNELWVHIDRLNPGDQFRIVIEADGRRWASDLVEVPRTQVEMRPQ